jgi:arsenite-transporting ATPase
MNRISLSYLDDKNPKIIMFCGKGGVGKTTTASATALHFAKKGMRTLLLSTDPSPSLSDILEVDVKGTITKIQKVLGLAAVELDYDDVVEQWTEKFGDEVYDVISSFLPVEGDIIEYIAGAPGIDEEFALSFVYDIYKSGEYDIIIWDTAPAGGTLSLLNIQERFYIHLGEAAKMYVRVKNALDALTQGRAKRDPLKIIGEWEQLARDVLNMVRDEDTKAILVTIPEALGVNQTSRIERDFDKFGINVEGVVVNYVLTPEAADSDFNRRRREMQLKYIKEIDETYSERLPVVHMPLLPFEVRGVEALDEVERILFKSD